MKETLKNIFMGIWLGLMMSGFVLSIIEGMLLLESRENYWLLLFFISMTIIALACIVFILKERISNITLIIGILTSVAVVISHILISLDLVLSLQ